MSKYTGNITRLFLSYAKIKKKFKEKGSKENMLQDVIRSIECLTKLYETDEKKQAFQEEMCIKAVEKEVEKINNSLINQGIIEKDMLFFHNGKEKSLNSVDLLNNRLFTFSNNLSILENLTLLSEKLETISQHCLSSAQTIQKSKEKVKELVYEACLELRAEERIFSHPHTLNVMFESYYAHKEGSYKARIYYNEKQLCTEFFELTVNKYTEKTVNSLKENMKNTIKNAWKAKEKQKKEKIAKELRLFANSVGKEYDQQFTFDIVEYLPQHVMYNIDEQKISLEFDLENEQLKETFKKEVLLPIHTIFEYEKIKEVNGKLKNIRVSSRYYYEFKEEKMVENDCYHLYECKGTLKKALLKVFKNGKQVTGRKRVQTLKKLGYGR